MRAVIFDFDGTIADSFAAVMSITHHLTKHEKLADPNYATTMRSNHVGLRQAIEILEIPRWRWPWLLKRGRRIMAHEIYRIPIFDGLEETLRQLNQAGYELFITSSNSKSNINRFMVEKGIEPYFKDVYGGVGLFKKARLLRRVLKKERLDKDSTIYVGDEVRDIEAAKELGMPSIAITWGYNSEQLLSKHSPTVIARSPQQLAKVIIEWGKEL